MATKKHYDLTQYINSLDIGAYKTLGKIETRLEFNLKRMLKQERLFLFMQSKINYINAEWIEEEWEEFFEEQEEDKEEALLAQYLLAYEQSQGNHKGQEVGILPEYDYCTDFNLAIDDIFIQHENNLDNDQKKGIKNSFSKTHMLKSMNDALTETRHIQDSPSPKDSHTDTHETVIQRVKRKLNISDDSVKKVHEQLINKENRPQWSYPQECSLAKEFFILERLCTLNRILGADRLNTESINMVQESFLNALCGTFKSLECGPIEGLLPHPERPRPGLF